MFIGIDIGTTATKAILIDDAQTIIASGSHTYEYTSRIAGYAEQHPQIWIDAVQSCLAQIREKNSRALATAKRIGLSGQMHSLVALDNMHKPIKAAMLWNDARGQAEADLLATQIPDIEEISGAAAMPSFSACKFLWMRNHERGLFDKIRHIALPKDMVRLWLTGELATDHSDAAGTQLYDQRQRNWSDAICGVIGIESSALPTIYESHEGAGRVRSEVASTLGLPTNCEVVIGGADTAAGALGLGVVIPGDSFITLGTSAIVATITNGYHPTSKGFLHNFAHCLPNQYYRMGAMLNGASALAWAARLVGADDIGQLLHAVEARFTGPSRVMFIPYLNGERTPHNNADLRGALLGLDSASDKFDIAQAVIEGVSLCLKDALLVLGLDANTIGAMGFIGGGARSPFWTKILASVLNVPLVKYEGADLWPALGAARLAMLASNIDQLNDIAKKPRIENMVRPETPLVNAYFERHRVYQNVQHVSFDFAKLK